MMTTTADAHAVDELSRPISSGLNGEHENAEQQRGADEEVDQPRGDP